MILVIRQACRQAAAMIPRGCEDMNAVDWLNVECAISVV